MGVGCRIIMIEGGRDQDGWIYKCLDWWTFDLIVQVCGDHQNTLGGYLVHSFHM